MSSKLPLLSCQQFFPGPALSCGGTSPHLGSYVPPSSCAWSITLAYPSSVPTHSSSSTQELQKEKRSSVGPCYSPACGQRQGLHSPAPWRRTRGKTKPCGAGQSCCPSPGSFCPATAAGCTITFWGPKGEQGMQDLPMPPSLPASMLPAPCPLPPIPRLL